MQIQMIDGEFSVCQVADYSLAPLGATYCFIGKTGEENSLVCLTSDVPVNAIAREDGWRAFRMQGVLEFSLIGILARISAVLANEGIALFALSTFNTDYILVKDGDYRRALDALRAAGCEIIGRSAERAQ